MSKRDTMRAMSLTAHGGPEVLVYLTDMPIPEPGRSEVLIKVGAAGINNTDINTRVGWYSKNTPFSNTMVFNRGKCRAHVSAGLSAPDPPGSDPLPMYEKSTTSRLGHATLIATIALSGVLTYLGPCRLVNLGEKRHIRKSISGDTSEYLKSSVVKPPCVHATKYSSVSILFLLRPTARKVLEPAAKTRVMAAIWRCDARISVGFDSSRIYISPDSVRARASEVTS